MIIYKAVMRGVPVVLVNEAYTSVTCVADVVCVPLKQCFDAGNVGSIMPILMGQLISLEKSRDTLAICHCVGPPVNLPLTMQLHRSHRL
jgi:hypothetical protein